MILSKRKRKILRAVVRSYIRSAEPIGSRTIARHYFADLSPATIRNEMADLEDMGYLEQPHTSAGRIPSQQGYRFYVDSLMEVMPLSKEEVLSIEKTLYQARVEDIEKLMREISRILSFVTRYTSFVMGPVIKKTVIKQFKILPLEEGRGLAVLLTDTGLVKHKVIRLPRSLHKLELEKVVRYLDSSFSGLTIDSITSSFLKNIKLNLLNQVEILDETLHLIEDINAMEGGNLFLGGTANILSQPEFRDMDRVKSLLAFFEEKTLLGHLLGNIYPEGIEVRIGNENKLVEIKDCSLVVATYRIDEKTVGTIGVLGPTRMEYARVIAMLGHMVKKLDDLV